MGTKIYISFPTNDYQIGIIKEFCRTKIDSQYIVSLRVKITDDTELGLSMFAHRPEIYFGIYSSKSKAIKTDETIQDALLRDILVDMDAKYAHATSRKPPVVNKELALAWIDYFNSKEARLQETVVEILH